MRDIQGKIKSLKIEVQSENIGSLEKESQFIFKYQTDEKKYAVSLVLPLRPEKYASNRLHQIFAMNLPEGALREKIKDRFESQFVKFDDMAMLSLTASNQIGFIRLKKESLVDNESISTRRAQLSLSEILKARTSDKLFDFLMDTYTTSGISGVQPKVLVPDADEEHSSSNGRISFRTPGLIVKSSSDEYPDLTQNEFLCMDAARIAGIQVPEFHLSEDASLFVMRRFDRYLEESEDGFKEKWLGFEDMAVLSGQTYDEYGNYKYSGSYEGVVSLIEAYCEKNSLESQQRFFEYLAASCLMRNGDAHLKNFGLLYESPEKQDTVRLAPLYDVVSTGIYQHINSRGEVLRDTELALKLNKSRQYPDKEKLIEFGKRCGVSNPMLVLERIQDGMSESLAKNKERVSSKLWDQMKKEWDSSRNSLSQRKINMRSRFKP